MTGTAIVIGLIVVLAFIIPMLLLMKRREKSHSDRVLKEGTGNQSGPGAFKS